MSEKISTKIGIVGADTTFLIDFFKGEEPAVDFMRAHARVLRVSELVIYEFLCGNLSPSDQALFFEAIQSFTTVPFNREAAIHASELYRKGKRSGKTVNHQDCMIAGSYLAHGISHIVTRNKHHFNDMKRVTVLTY